MLHKGLLHNFDALSQVHLKKGVRYMLERCITHSSMHLGDDGLEKELQAQSVEPNLLFLQYAQKITWT